MKRYEELAFKFLRDNEEVKERRQYTKAETFYAGSILFADISTFKLLEEGLIAKGDSILNKIIKINSIRSRANNLVNQYKEKIDNPNKGWIEDIEQMSSYLAMDIVVNIMKYEQISVVYNELAYHEESFDYDDENFDCRDERKAIINKVDEIMFNRFTKESWVAPESENYNEPPCELKVKRGDGSIAQFKESYIDEFMKELSVYMGKCEDIDIIKAETIVENDAIFRELDVDYKHIESYRQIKKALINTEEMKRICNDTLVVDNVGELLKEQRNFLKMTMRDVSEVTGLTTGYLSRLENGSSLPSLEALTKLCTAYGITNINNFLKDNILNSKKGIESVDLEGVFKRNLVLLDGKFINSFDTTTILKLTKFLLGKYSTESKDALRIIIDNLIKLEENKN